MYKGGICICAPMLNWKSASSLGSHLSLIIISHEVPPSRSLDSPKSALMKSRIVILAFVLLPSLGISNSSISLLLKLSLTLTSSVSSFLFVSGISNFQSSMLECRHQCLHQLWIVPCCVAPSADPEATKLIWFQNYMRYFGSLTKFEIFSFSFLWCTMGSIIWARQICDFLVTSSTARQAEVLFANYDYQT